MNSFTWPVIWRAFLCLVIVAAAGGFTARQLGMVTADLTPRDLITASAALIAIVTFLLSAWNSEVQRRKQQTMSLLQDRHKSDFRILLERRSATFPPGTTVDPDAFLARANSIDAISARQGADALQALLNHYEFIALALKNGNLDHDMMRKSIRGVMCNLVHDCRLLIAHVRKDNSLIFEHLVPLYNEWLTPGKHEPIMIAQQTKKSIWPVIVMALPALAILLALGTWQVQRLAWKEGLLADIDARINSAPVGISTISERFENDQPIDYVPVTVTGTFDHKGEAHFLATHKSASGFYIYAPLTIADGKTVFVNRGFVPYDLKETDARPQTLIDGPTTITGLSRARLDERPSSLVPDNDVAKNVFYWKDLSAMTAKAGLDQAQVLPFFIDAGLPSQTYSMGDWPVQGVTIINLPNNHLQYAITWYGLALALIGVVGFFIAQRVRPVTN